MQASSGNLVCRAAEICPAPAEIIFSPGISSQAVEILSLIMETSWSKSFTFLVVGILFRVVRMLSSHWKFCPILQNK